MLAEDLQKLYPVKVIDRVIAKLSEGETYKKIGNVESIPVNAVLAETFSKQRLENALLMLDQGKDTGYIYAERFVLPDQSELYRLSDGAHRIIAARMRKKHTIKAHISGQIKCSPNLYITCQQHLWRKSKDEEGPRLIHWGKFISTDEESCAEFLGVKSRTPDELRPMRLFSFGPLMPW